MVAQLTPLSLATAGEVTRFGAEPNLANTSGAVAVLSDVDFHQAFAR